MAARNLRSQNISDKAWRHEEIAELLGRITIKTSSGFLEKTSDWACPACQRSKAQIVAPGRNVNIVACVYLHHDHIENLIGDLLARSLPRLARGAPELRRRQDLRDELERRFCRFERAEICHACNNLDAAAKAIVAAPQWFSFSPHGIGTIIKRPVQPYAVRHEVDRYRLDLVWDKVSGEIEGLEDRVYRAIQDAIADVA